MPGPARTAKEAAGAKAGLSLDFLNVIHPLFYPAEPTRNKAGAGYSSSKAMQSGLSGTMRPDTPLLV
jgi:hypothetical protein